MEEIKEPNLEETKETPPVEESKKEDTTEPKKEKKKKHDAEKDALIKANLELKEKTLRLSAEMQNMKKRSELELSNAYKYDGIDFIEKFLPILDNFERAINIKTSENEKFLSGFKMIYDNFISILKDKGVKEIECLHQEFDPNVMNAVLTETNEEYANNIVLDVLQKGYMYKDKLIRPAMVKVNDKESE